MKLWVCLLHGLFISIALKSPKALVFLFLSFLSIHYKMSGLSALAAESFALRIYLISRGRPAGNGCLLSKDYRSSGDEPPIWLSNNIRLKSQHYPDTVGCIYTFICTHIKNVTIFFMISLKFERGDMRGVMEWKTVKLHNHIRHSKSK